jgi:predicted nucleic acid-binding protein
MILYLDTSSVVKLYLDEPRADSVRRWALHAEVLATSRVAYPEAVAALARRSREGDLAPAAFQRVLLALKQQWRDFAVLDLNEMQAGDLAVKHALRGLDAIHLAAALDLRHVSSDARIAFSSFDVRLNQAATAEGLPVLDVKTA